MKKVFLNTNTMYSMEDIHKYLASELGFSETYGNNLDALYDELTSLDEPITVQLYCGKNEIRLPDRETAQLIRVLQDASNEKFRVSVIEEEDDDLDSEMEM